MSDLEPLAEGLADEDPAVREDCARALAELGDPKAAPFLLHALDDDEEQVRMWGAYGLGMLGAKTHRELLERAVTEEASPLLQVWASFALVRLGVDSAMERLVAGLGHARTDVRANAADALLSTDRKEQVKKALSPLLQGPNEAAQVWAAALLHKLGDKQALAVWRHGLGSPTARVDAALSATYTEDAAVARELLRVVGELSIEELEQPATEEGAILAEVLTHPLLELPLDEVIAQAATDDGARTDLLLFLARSPGADPDLFDQIQAFVTRLAPATRAQAVADLLLEQDEGDRPLLLSNLSTFSSEVVVPALQALPEAARKKLLDRAITSVRSDAEDSASYYPLIEALREGPFAALVEGLTLGFDESETTEAHALALQEDDEDDPLTAIVRRMVAKEEVTPAERKEAEAFLAENELTAEEYLEQLDAELDDFADVPPDPVEVARRALAIAGILRRAQLEEEVRKAPERKASTQRALDALRAWMDEHDFPVLLNEVDIDLLYADLGAWTEDDLQTAGWAAEELGLLLWAIGRVPGVPAEDRFDGRALTKDLPLGKPPEAFIESAELRKIEELGHRAEYWAAFKARVEQEALARHIKLEGIEETGLDPETLLAGVAEEGFDRKAAEKAHGKNGAISEALRFVGRLTAKRAEEEGLIKRIGDDFPFRGKPLGSIKDEELAVAIALAAERRRALRWVTTGSLSEEDEGDEDEEEAD